MSTELSSKPPGSFYLIGGVALLWNLLGVAAYVSQVTMTPEALSALPEAERMLYENVPSWTTAAFAIAVNGGALGCLLLLLRKAIATPVLIVSLIGVLVQMYHSLFIANSIEVYGPGGAVMPISVVVIAAFLIWYSMDAKKRGYIS
jgi:hypothetical protein